MYPILRMAQPDAFGAVLAAEAIAIMFVAEKSRDYGKLGHAEELLRRAVEGAAPGGPEYFEYLHLLGRVYRDRSAT